VWDTLYSKANLLLPAPPSWGSASFANCSLHLTLQQLRQRERAGLPPRHRTGGLGRMMQPSIFEVNLLVSGMSEVCVCVCVCVRDFPEGAQAWVCVDQHECSSSSPPMDGWFCWVRKLLKTSLLASFFICKCAVEIESGGMRR